MKFPRWLTYAFLLALGYMVYSTSQYSVPKDAVTKPLVPAITQETYPTLATLTDAERWKRKLDPDYAATMNCTLDAPKGENAKLMLEEVEAGEGTGVACGETITIHLTIWSSNGSVAYAGEFPLALGSRQFAAGLDVGLSGMKPGAVRRLMLPPYALVRGKKPGAVPAAALTALPHDKLAFVTVKRVK